MKYAKCEPRGFHQDTNVAEVLVNSCDPVAGHTKFWPMGPFPKLKRKWSAGLVISCDPIMSYAKFEPRGFRQDTNAAEVKPV